MADPDHLGPCGWQALLTPRCPEPALDGAWDCDLAVVGAGYTGLSAARTWARARPQDRIAVLEADVVGEGGPGRHSGLLLEVALTDAAGPAVLARIARFNRLLGETLAALQSLVREHGIPWELERAGLYRAAVTSRGARRLERWLALLDAVGRPYEPLDGAALQARLGTSYYRSGFFLPNTALIQPAALIRGLADALPDNVSLFEETPALTLERADAGWQIDCPRGRVRARRVLLANDGFAGVLAPALRARLAVAYTGVGLTRPLAAAGLAGLADGPGWALLPAHPLGVGLRRTAEGRLLVQAFAGYERPVPAGSMAARLEAAVRRRFAGLPTGAGLFDHVWGRATGATGNGAPVWGEVAPGLLVSAGANGAGPLQGMLLGTLLAKRALGERVPDVADLLGAPRRLPPWPIRRIALSIERWGLLGRAGGEV